MADSLIDLPGSGLTPTVINPPRIRYPFRNNPVTPDVYARVTERDFKLAAANYDTNGRLASRTSYTNLLVAANNFSSGAWVKINSGAGSVAPVVTAGFIAPDGGAAFRLVMDRGAGGGNFDSIGQSVTGLANPHDIGCAIWMKSNTGVSQVIGIQTGQSGPVAATVTPSWQQYTRTESAHISTAIQFSLFSIGQAIGGDQVVDIIIAYAQADVVASIGPYVPASSTKSVPDVDSIANSTIDAANQLDPFAFLVAESDPVWSDALLGQFTRAYARLPAPQLIPSTKFFTRPVLDDVFVSATAWAVSFDPFQKYSWVFTSTRKSITSIGPLVLGTTPIAQSYSSLPATTVTFTDSGAHAVAVFFNSGASSIQASLAAALTSLGAITVTSTGSGLQIAWANGAGTMKSIESTSTAVTMGGGISALTVTFEPSQTNTQAPNPNPATRGVLCTGHGGHVGDYVVFWYNDRIIARSKVLIVTDANNFSVMGNDINGADIAPNYCGFSANANACYVNGSKVCTTRKTTTFYLPGYSVGITTYADIPTQLTYLDSLSWLGRILAVPTGWANIEVSEVTQWMGAILQQEITEIQMDDALDTVTP